MTAPSSPPTASNLSILPTLDEVARMAVQIQQAESPETLHKIAVQIKTWQTVCQQIEEAAKNTLTATLVPSTLKEPSGAKEKPPQSNVAATATVIAALQLLNSQANKKNAEIAQNEARLNVILNRYEERLGQMVSKESGHIIPFKKDQLIRIIRQALTVPLGGHTLSAMDPPGSASASIKKLQMHQVSHGAVEIFDEVDIDRTKVLGKGASATIYEVYSVSRAHFMALRMNEAAMMTIQVAESERPLVRQAFRSYLETQQAKLELIHRNGIVEGIILPGHLVEVYISAGSGSATQKIATQALGVLQDRAIGNLFQMTKAGKLNDLSYKEKLQHCWNLLRGLEKLHENHIFHRDINASNILVFQKSDKSLSFKLGDFDDAVLVRDVNHLKKEVDLTQPSSPDNPTSFMVNVPSTPTSQTQTDLNSLEKILQKDMLYTMGKVLVFFLTGNEEAFKMDEAFLKSVKDKNLQEFITGALNPDPQLRWTTSQAKVKIEEMIKAE